MLGGRPILPYQLLPLASAPGTVMCPLKWKQVIEWDHLKPQGLGLLLAPLPSEECHSVARCVVVLPFFSFHAGTWGEPTRPSEPGTEAPLWHGKKGFLLPPPVHSQWIPRVDLKLETRFECMISLFMISFPCMPSI